MPRVKVRPNARRAAAPTFAELSRADRFWVTHPSRETFLAHRLGCGLTVAEWLASEDGRALVARYPHLEPDRWGARDQTAEEIERDYAAHLALEAECAALDAAS